MRNWLIAGGVILGIILIAYLCSQTATPRMTKEACFDVNVMSDNFGKPLPCDS